MGLVSMGVLGQEVSKQEWLTRAEQGDAEAIYMLGYKGIGEKAGSYYYEMAARKGYPEAITHMLDELLFRAHENADVQKAKEFSDIARKMKIDSQIHRNLDVVDICAKAGKPDMMSQGRTYYPDFFFQGCENEKTDSEAFKSCLLRTGNNIDMATMYANSVAVKQDLWKALSYACHGCSIPAELESMALKLYKAAEIGKLEEPFSFCDHATGMNSSTACYLIEVGGTERRLYAELDSFATSFDEDEKRLFETLKQKAFDFFDRRASSEQDLSGAMRGIFEAQWELEQRQFFLEAVKMLETQALTLPKKDSVKTQKALDQLYKKLIRTLEKDAENRIAEDMSLAIQAKHVQMTQEDWTEFQEAFMVFVKKRYPKINQDYFKAWLFEKRIEQLTSLLEELSYIDNP